LRFVELAWPRIDHTERPEAEPVRIDDRIAGVEPKFRFVCDGGIRREALIGARFSAIMIYFCRIVWLQKAAVRACRRIPLDRAPAGAIEASGEPFLSAFRQRARSSRWVAIVAAYLLVLQAVFAGMASGAHAGNLSLDRTLAMTLCAPGEMPAGGGSEKGTAQHDQMTCCVLGCVFSGGVEPAATADFVPVIHRTIDLIAFARRLDAPHGYVAGRSPANPRAPPSEI
jgi:hypothetical protein